MIYEIDGKLVSGELFDEKFVCDLAACKGACCIEGDAGAPLSEEEASLLDDIYEEVKPFMRKEGIDAIAEEGTYTVDGDGELVTTLVNNAECAYVIFDDNNIAKCAIEDAFNAGKVDFKKPISCHLYPIRVADLSAGDALNYDKWKICEAACACGNELNVAVYAFLKEPLIRKFGEEFYGQLQIVDKMQKEQK